MSDDSVTSITDPLAELLIEARAAAAWRATTDAWRDRTDANIQEIKSDVHTLQNGLANHLLEDGQAMSRLVTQADGDQRTVLQELLNVKREVLEDVKRVGSDFEGASMLAGQLPALKLQLSQAQVDLANGAKQVIEGTAEIKAAGTALKNERAMRTRWRKLQGPLIVVVTAVLGALTQRFVLPPAAQNDPGTLLPGRMPTVHASPSASPRPEQP